MKVIYLLLLSFISISIQAQNLRFEKGRLYQDNTVLAPNQWESAFAGNTDALEYVKKAKSNNSAAGVIGFIGGFMVGWPLGTAIAGGEPEWAMAGAGAGLIGIAIPLASATKKNMNKAIELQGGNPSMKKEVGFLLKGNQIGIQLQF